MHLQLHMLRQPTDSSCGPTCLHAIYRYFGVEYDLAQLIDEIPQFEEGGTLSVHLAQHALRRGFDARLVTYNLRIFDPTWWCLGPRDMIAKLQARLEHLQNDKARHSHRAYIEFLELGGQLDFFDLDPDSLERLLSHGAPILTGLSATYLYQHPRELPDGRDDDVAGSPTGHFVVVNGWHAESAQVLVMDPFEQNPFNPQGEYRVGVHRFINSVMLGILTYDANLLVVTPPRARRAHA
jgi:hypothetical protein